MNDLERFLDYALEYEVNHQLILCRLLNQPPVASAILGFEPTEPVIREPKGGLFDLEVVGPGGKVYIEIKAGYGSLHEPQLGRQRVFLEAARKDGATVAAVYALFGYSAFEYDESSIPLRTGDAKTTILTNANLPMLLERAESKLAGEHAALSRSYRNRLEGKWRELQESKDLTVSRLRHYGAIREVFEKRDIHNKLDKISTCVYRTNNASGTVVILNDRAWEEIKMNGATARIYQEVNDGKLCIKLQAEHFSSESRRALRDELRQEGERTLNTRAPGLALRRSGRLGQYMTALVVGGEDIDSIPSAEAAARIATVHEALPLIAERVRQRVQARVA